ncbi:AP-3 complex subunit delta [Linum perenne]
MDSLFQRSLDDIIKGLRHQQTGDSLFISKVLEEIRREIKSTDLHTKSTALHKLTYLHSIHFLDMSWAAFHAIECISSSNFSHKKIGYLAISQSFHESTPVILLITNQLRKDLKSNAEAEVSLALECLSRIGNLDLCRDLTPEVFTLMATSKLLVKKKAIGLLLMLFGKYPDSVRVCFKRLVESLESGDSPPIVSAVIGVFCELASRDPRAYLPLAPEFYKILVDSRNNWVLIKVLKIFTKLAPLEPRLAKKIVEPICELMRKTGAKSLMFECIRTILTSLTDYESAVRLSAGRINELLVDEDPNLRYLGLHALALIAPKHIWAVLENKEVVIKSLSDADPNIKLESLRLVMAMMSDSNVVEICRVLMNYANKSEPEFCNQILGSILSTCSHNVYEIVVDFDWYVSLLGEMSRVQHCQKGEEIEDQLIDIAMRVEDARPELVRVARDLVIDPALLGNSYLHRILSAAAWVCGEYVEFTRRPVELVEALLQPRTSLLPTHVRAVYMESAFKVLIFLLHSYIQNESSNSEYGDLATDQEFNPRVSNQSNGDFSGADGDKSQESRCNIVEEKYSTSDPILYLFNLIDLAVSPLSGSYDVEIQERTRNILGFLELIRPDISDSSSPEDAELKEGRASTVVRLLHDSFLNELGPISTSAQGRVAIPDGLVLHDNLADLEAVCGSSEVPASWPISFESYYNEEGGSDFIADYKEKSELSTESTSLLVEHRKRHGLYYLSSEKNEHVGNDYPPANELKSGIRSSDDAEDLVKVAEQSFMPKRKSKQVKARPVVVKLDEGDKQITSEKPETKVDSISDAVREVLLGNEGEAGSSREKSTATGIIDKKKGKVKMNVEGEKEDSEKMGSESQQQIPAKERSKRSSGKKKGGDMEKHRRKHRHGRHNKTDQVHNSVIAQTPVVTDLLL